MYREDHSGILSRKMKTALQYTRIVQIKAKPSFNYHAEGFNRLAMRSNSKISDYVYQNATSERKSKLHSLDNELGNGKQSIKMRRLIVLLMEFCKQQ